MIVDGHLKVETSKFAQMAAGFIIIIKRREKCRRGVFYYYLFYIVPVELK